MIANDPVKTDNSLDPLTNPLMDSRTDVEKVFFPTLPHYFSSHESEDMPK
jgi:hypothetical protein